MAITTPGNNPGTSSSYVSNSTSSRAGFVPNALDWIALVLAIIGGINWGLVGAFRFDLVAAIFGEMSNISRVVYVLVGLAALYCLSFLARFSRSA